MGMDRRFSRESTRGRRLEELSGNWKAAPRETGRRRTGPGGDGSLHAGPGKPERTGSSKQKFRDRVSAENTGEERGEGKREREERAVSTEGEAAPGRQAGRLLLSRVWRGGAWGRGATCSRRQAGQGARSRLGTGSPGRGSGPRRGDTRLNEGEPEGFVPVLSACSVSRRAVPA